MEFDRYTDRARKVMALANQEAQRFNHEYIGTEHLLLGLLQEHDGVAAQVLMNLGCKLEEVREEVLNLIGAGKVQDSQHESSPEKVSHVTGYVSQADVAAQQGEAAQASWTIPPVPTQNYVSSWDEPTGDVDETQIGIQIAQLQSQYDKALSTKDDANAGRLLKEIEKLDKLLTEIQVTHDEDADFAAALKAVDKALAKLVIVSTDPTTILEDIDASRVRIDGALLLVRDFLEYRKNVNG